MAKGVKVTESKWKAIKILLESGATYNEIKEMIMVSNTVISFAKKSETYEEFRHKLYLTSGAYRKRMAAEAKTKLGKEIKAQEVANEVKAVRASELIKEEPEEKVVEHQHNVTLVANNYLMEEIKKQNELLTLISNKLAFIVDELTR